MNDQTPGPVKIAGSYITRDVDGKTGHRLAWVMTDGPYEQTAPTAALLAAAYTSYDKAGRELGVDATLLAQTIDIVALVRLARRVQDLSGLGWDKFKAEAAIALGD